MLAQSFKSYEDLKITEPQHLALQKTLALFETGQVEFFQTDDGTWSPGQKGARKFSGFFNMGQWKSQYHECGTVACIGGTAEMIGRVRFGHTTGGLHDLFFPHVVKDWDQISVEKAASALRNYLTYGEPRWGTLFPKSMIQKVGWSFG